MLRGTLLIAIAGAVPLSAHIALLAGEPFGRFGTFNPTGHAAVYLEGVCAETPTKLRLCGPGETGVVISRYFRVGGYDWIAIPLVPYLYAVERLEDVPARADAGVVLRLRDSYRRRHLRSIVPDGEGGETPGGDWIQLVGSAYDRKIYGFAVETRREDDARLIEYLNSRPNVSRFNILYRNCADFARAVVNVYHPGALRRGVIADAGISTPKHSAKTLVTYARKRRIELRQFVIPQIPGEPPSKKLRGVSESLVWSKKYVVPLALVQPWVAATAAVAYFSKGRFDPLRQPATTCDSWNLLTCVPVRSEIASGRAEGSIQSGQ